MSPTPFPDVTRPDAELILVNTLDAGEPVRQRTLVDTAVAERRRQTWPAGLLSVSWFADTRGESILAYQQWTGDGVWWAYAAARGRRSDGDRAEPVLYRRYRSLAEGDPAQVPGCLVTATFDTEGPERQRTFVDTVIAGLPHDQAEQGAISAHFHLSCDGTRVLLYTEWTSEEAHEAAARSGAHDKSHELFSSVPGVHPTSGRRYHLYEAMTRD
ncbi:antibiotic biosynthesis monooxygenase family protein [Streptomyces sp. MAR4 CNY-716]